MAKQQQSKRAGERVTKPKPTARKVGKSFEQQFRASCPEEIYIQRLYDGKWRNPADYIVHDGTNMIFLELKTTKFKRLDRKNIKDHQLNACNVLNQRKGMKAGFVINFRELEETYYMSGEQMAEFFANEEVKSMPVDHCRREGIRVGHTKKRTRYTYNYNFLSKI